MSSLSKESEKKFPGKFNYMEPFITITTDPGNPFDIKDVSENIEELTGYHYSLFLEKKVDFFSLICVDDLIVFENQLNDTVNNNLTGSGIDDFRIISINNDLKYLKTHIYRVEDLLYLQLLDVTEYYERLKENSELISRYKNLMITLDAAVWDWNIQTGKVYYSARWYEMLGYAGDELSGTLDDWKESVHPDDLDEAMEAINRHLSGKVPIYECTYRLKKKSGDYIWVRDRGIRQIDDEGEVKRMIGSHSDITAGKEIRENLEKMIITDDLTGLFNRRHYDIQLKDEMMRAERYGSRLSIIMIDIDLFKQINDTYGHQAGDKALQELARVIKKKIRNTDSAYRIGGEEFMIIAPQTNEENAVKAAERLRNAVIESRIETKYGSFSFTISLGVTTFTKGDTYCSFNERADIALYRSKDSGRNRTSIYP